MGEKTFIVTHAKAREPITITGKTLAAALKKERLDPAIWKLMPEPKPPPEVPFGEDN